jgi:AAA ATPase domain
MIREVSIRDFKSLRDVRIQMDRFTDFVGPNAWGKSSILQALNLLCRGFRPPRVAFGTGFDPWYRAFVDKEFFLDCHKRESGSTLIPFRSPFRSRLLVKCGSLARRLCVRRARNNVRVMDSPCGSLLLIVSR